MSLTVSPITAADKDVWRPLFEGYAAFYQVPITATIIDTVWGWLIDPEHVMEGLLVRDATQQVVGMLHFRSCPRSLSGQHIAFVDDMFVHPDARGSGAADALFVQLERICSERGWTTARWITQHYNARGRAFYDRYTNGPSDFILYQWDF